MNSEKALKNFVVIGLIIVVLGGGLGLYFMQKKFNKDLEYLGQSYRQHQQWRIRSDALLERAGVRHEVDDDTLGMFWMVPLLEQYERRIAILEEQVKVEDGREWK